jgi:hypothetical protein
LGIGESVVGLDHAENAGIVDEVIATAREPFESAKLVGKKDVEIRGRGIVTYLLE